MVSSSGEVGYNHWTYEKLALSLCHADEDAGGWSKDAGGRQGQGIGKTVHNQGRSLISHQSHSLIMGIAPTLKRLCSIPFSMMECNTQKKSSKKGINFGKAKCWGGGLISRTNPICWLNVRDG